jgi:signal transduction histidine kinase
MEDKKKNILLVEEKADLDLADAGRLEKDKPVVQMFQTQKIEALGRPTWGIAYDFNNLLSVIGTFSYILQKKTEDDSPLRVYINQIDKAVKKGADLINGILAYSRSRQADGNLVYLNKIVKDAKNSITAVIGDEIVVREISTDHPLIIRADSMQIHQMLLDLATNACDAMPEGGILTISTGLMETNDEFIRTHGDAKAAAYALISVENAGKRMEEGTEEKIFKPFVTDRKAGNGTWLALSNACGIVWQHNGYIDIYGKPGEGTIFRIYFPIIDMKRLEEII